MVDTYHVNEKFFSSDTSELATPGAWEGLNFHLNIAQIDTECAFYRTASPSKLMVLLPLRRTYIVANCLDVDVCHVSSSLVSSRLIVLSIGIGAFSSAKPLWRLIFWLWVLKMPNWCTIVGANCRVVSRCGSLRGQCCGYRRKPTASDWHDSDNEKQVLESDGLRCEVSWSASSSGNGAVSVLSFSDATAHDFLCGDELHQQDAHFNWAALLRRPLLFIFSAGFRFGHRAGSWIWRVWISVRTYPIRVKLFRWRVAYVRPYTLWPLVWRPQFWCGSRFPRAPDTSYQRRHLRQLWYPCFWCEESLSQRKCDAWTRRWLIMWVHGPLAMTHTCDG